MDEKAKPSCWGLTTKVMIAVAGLIILTYLAGSPETGAVLAAG